MFVLKKGGSVEAAFFYYQGMKILGQRSISRSLAEATKASR